MGGVYEEWRVGVPVLAEEAGYDEKLVRGWFWDAEILIRAQSEGYKISEIPVEWESVAESSFNLRRELRMMPYMIGLRRKI